MSNQSRVIQYLCFISLMSLTAGCAFDVSYVKTVPCTFVPETGSGWGVIFDQDLTVGLGTGFPTRLKKGTIWHKAGSTGYGDVFVTGDQIVTVEASDVYE